MINTKSKRTTEILNYLATLYPNAQCELTYHKDYELLIAIVLSAQTTDKSVNKVTPKLFQKYKTLKELSTSSLQEIEEIIREIGTYKKKSIFIKEIATKLVNDYQGKVPNNRKYLESLPGVGRKTTNVFLSEYYHIPALAVDTHVNRVSKRLGLAKKEDSIEKVEEKLKRKIPKKECIKTHHRFIFFGRYFCKAKNPNCQECKIKYLCSEKNR